ALRAGVVAHRAEHAGGDERAQRDEDTVPEIEHVHQPEHQRQPRGDDEDDHAHREAGHGQREPRRARADERQHQERQQRHERHRFPVEIAVHIASPSSECCNSSFSASSFMEPVCTTRPLSITATESPRRLAKLMFCSTRRIDTPLAFSCANASIMLLMIAGASPLLGSSTISSSRGSTIARATASICFCPPESLPAGWFQNFSTAGNSEKIHCRRWGSIWPAFFAQRAASSMFSFTVRSPKMPMFSGT